MANHSPIRVGPHSESAQTLERLVGSLLSTRVLLVLAIVGAALFLCVTAGILQPIVQQNSFAGRASLVLLLIVLTLLSCMFPASGPNYGERVPLTPLVAVISLLLLPPAFAVAPLFLVGIALYLSETQQVRRASVMDRFLLLIASEMLTGLLLRYMKLNIDAYPHYVKLAKFLQIGVAAALIFAVFYGIGLCLMTFRRTDSELPRPSVPSRHEWNVFWVNELVVYVVACPVAVSLSLLFARYGALIGALVLLLVTTLLIIVTRLLVDGKMVRLQLHAMERLTLQAAIGRSPGADQFLTEYLEHCRKLILYDRATVWLYNEQELYLEKTVEFHGKAVAFQPQVKRFGEDLVGRVAERGNPMLVEDARNDPRHRYSNLPEAEQLAMGPVSAMLAPFKASGELVGVVEFERRGLSPYAKQDRERIQSLSGLVAMTLANNRLHHDVMQQAVTDGLTDLYNKRQILKTLSDEAMRAQRYGHTLSVMMLDLDGFKKYNDTFGHMQGDVLLQMLAELIKQSIRTSDIAGRYGGEEFIVVMPETGREAAWVTAERIRARVESERFSATINYEASIGLQAMSDEHQPRVVSVQKTISIGVATYPADALEPLELLARADEALYAAKNSGRNRVVVASYPTESQPRTIAGTDDSSSR